MDDVPNIFSAQDFERAHRKYVKDAQDDEPTARAELLEAVPFESILALAEEGCLKIRAEIGAIMTGGQ